MYRETGDVRKKCNQLAKNSDNQGPDFDDMSSFFPYEMDNAVGYGA